jgi:hypothetical protein
MVSSPVAPARRTRAAGSSTNRAAGGVGPAGALPGVEDLAGVGAGGNQRVVAGGNQRVVAQGVGGAVGGALLCVAVDLADGGVQVDGHGPITGAGTSGPRAQEELFGEPVELAGVPEGEGA